MLLVEAAVHITVGQESKILALVVEEDGLRQELLALVVIPAMVVKVVTLVEGLIPVVVTEPQPSPSEEVAVLSEAPMDQVRYTVARGVVVAVTM